MPFYGGPDPSVPPPTGTDIPLPFNKALAVADTAEDFATIPVSRKGRKIALINLGPGSAYILPDNDATASPTASIEVKKGEQYADDNLEIATRWSFIGEAGKQPVIRGVVWAGV